MASQKQAKVVITANATTAKKVLEEIDNLVVKYTADVQKMVAAGQANTAECKKAEATLKALSQVQRDNIADTKRLGEVVKDLTNTKLRDLRRALGSGKSALAALTGSDADMKKAEQIRKQMKMVGDEIRLIEGQYVKIAQGLGNVKNQSDQWLDKAIKQQKELVASLQKTDSTYNTQLATLRQLEAEEDRRKGKMNYAQAQTTFANAGNSSASELRRAKTAITEHRDASFDRGAIAADNKMLAELQKQLDLIEGKEQKATIGWQKMKQVLQNPFRSSAEDIKATMDAIQKKIAKLPAGSQRVADLRRQYEQLEKVLKGTKMSQQQLNDILTRAKSGKASIDELKRAYKQLEDELSHIKDLNGDAFKNGQKDLKALKKQIDEVTGAANKQGGAWKTALHNLTACVGMFAVFNKAKDILTGAIHKNYEYSSSLTDIRKVSGLAGKDIDELSRKLATIDTRTSVDGLAQLAYQGSKLGMAEHGGAEGLYQFVKAADQINVAIGEELGEEALPALSKLVETMGLIPKMGIEKSMLATGSAMFKLSTTSTSTSNNIVEMARRLTGVSRVAGITTDQMLALSSASDSLFLAPEVSATAFSKFIVALQKNHNLIEKDLGIQEGTIKKMYAAGNAMDAIVMVLEKMRDKGNMNALGGIFKDLGSDGQRLVTAMVTMSKNVDVLKDHLHTSSEAFEEASAVTAEYKMQQESAIGILDRANNLWEKAFVNPTGVQMVKDLAQAWYNASAMMTYDSTWLGSLQAALKTIIWGAEFLVRMLPILMNMLLAKGVAMAWMKIVEVWTAARTAITAATTAQIALNTAMKSNIFGAIAGVIMSAVGWIWAYVTATTRAKEAQEEAAKKANEWKNKLKDAQAETDSATRKLNSFKTALDNANLSEAQRTQQISRFNKEFRTYISKLGIEIKNVKDLKKHYNELAAEIQRATYYRLREQAKEDAMPAFQKDRLNAENRIKQHIKTFQNSYGGFTAKGIMDMFANGANANWVYQQMIKGSHKNVDKNGITFDNKTGAYSYTTNSGAKVKGGGDQNLLSALRHYQNATARERNKEKEINDYFGDFVPEDYHPWVDEEPGTLENDAPDKEAAKAAKAAALAQAKEWREQLKEAQNDANAIIDKVKNYYERQILEVTQKANELNLDEAQTEALIRPVRERMNTALGVARKAISNVEQGWDTFKQTMKDDMIEVMGENGLNESQMLLDQIEKADLQALQKKIAELSKSLNRPESALMDQIWRNATKNAQANADAERKQREEIQKILLEHNYTGIVDNNTTQQMEKIGAFGLSAKQVQTLLGGKEGEAEAMLNKRAKEISTLLKNARESIVDLYTTDVTTDDGRNKFLNLIFKDIDQSNTELGEILKLQGDNIKAFYQELLKYSDEYTQAQQKEYNEQKRIVEFIWKQRGFDKDQQRRQNAADTKKNMFPDQHGFGSRLGFATQKYDPEVEGYKLKLQFAQEYYAFVMENSKNTQLQEEAQMSVLEAQNKLTESMVKAMQERMEKVKQFAQPIVDFGSAAGEALAQFSDDVDSAQKAMKNAVKSMLKSWGEMMINDLTSQMMQGMKNGMSAKVVKKNTEKKPDVASTVTEGVTDGLTDAIDPTSPEAMAEQTLEVEDWKYEKMLELESAYQEMSLEQWKEYYAQKMAASGEATADGSEGGSSPLDKQAEQNEALLEQQQEQNQAMINLHNIGQSAANAAIKEGLNLQFKIRKKANKDAEKDDAKTKDAMVENAEQTEDEKTDIIDAGATVQMAAQTALNAKVLTASKATNAERVQGDAATTEAETTLSIVEAMAKCFSFLGPIAGPIMAGVVQALLMGLLQWGLSKALGGGSDSKKGDTAKGPNTKLVSGMLTYDSGNVSDLKPFFDKDGNMYWAEDNSDQKNQDISLLTTPTATTINGQPSLVAEQGPELVIGRETTQAIMQDNPALLRALYQYDRHHSGRTAYDQGNLSEQLANLSSSGALGATASTEGISTALADATASNVALLTAVNALLTRLNEPIKASINMYGRDGLYESNKKANAFMKNR